jgi:NADH:ubiquinone oxidoreductase subunit 4 (subunit M)
LIPTLFLILGWGYQPERVQACIYLLFYTLLASLPLLVGILFVCEQTGHKTLSSTPYRQFENQSTKYHRQQPPV